MDLLSSVLEYGAVALQVVGALALASRYTPWKWDDKLFSAVEKPLSVVLEAAKKLKGKK